MDKFLPLLLEMVRWENTVEEGVDKLTKGMVVANTEGASQWEKGFENLAKCVNNFVF